MSNLLIFNKDNPCPYCRHPEFEKSKATDGRPRFICTSCEYSWTNGHSGGEYLETAKRIGNKWSNEKVNK